MILLGREEVDRIVLLGAVVVELVDLAIVHVFSYGVNVIVIVSVNVNMNVSVKAIGIQSDLMGTENVAFLDFFVYDGSGFGLGPTRKYAPGNARCDVDLEDFLSDPYIAYFCSRGPFCPLS